MVWRTASPLIRRWILRKNSQNLQRMNSVELPYQQLVGIVVPFSMDTTRYRPCHERTRTIQLVLHATALGTDQEGTSVPKRYEYSRIFDNLWKKKLRHFKLTGYANAKYAGNEMDRRSYTGLAYILRAAAINWESRKQQSVTLSSIEAEYMTLSDATRGRVYLQGLLEELTRFSHKPLYIDNQSSRRIASQTHGNRTKHIDVRHQRNRIKV